MADDRTTLDSETTLERIRSTVESIKEKMPVADTSFFDPIINRIVSLLNVNVPSPTATGGGNNSAVSETPIEGMASTLTAIKTRLDSAISAFANQGKTSANQNQPLPTASPQQQWMLFERIARTVESIRHRLDANAIVATTPPSSAPPPSPTTTTAPSSRTEGFLDFMKGIGASISKAWSSPAPPAPPSAVPVAPPMMMGMPITNPALKPTSPTAAVAPPVAPPTAPSWLSGLGNLLSSGLGKMAGKPEGFGDRLSGFGSKINDAAHNPSGAGGFGDVLGGAAKVAGAIPGIGTPIAGVMKLGEVAFNSVDKLQTWTRGLHEANMQFAEFSGAMAQVQANQMTKDIENSIRSGDDRAESAQNLADGMNELRDAMYPLTNAMANGLNFWGEVLSKGMARLSKYISDLINGKEDDKNKTETDGGVPLHIEAGMYGEEYWEKKANPKL